MANQKFGSLSSFLASTANIEKKATEDSVRQGAETAVQKIMNESSVKLSVYSATVGGEMKPEAVPQFIQKSMEEAVQANADRMQSIIEELFYDNKVSEERELFWINKLCLLFNINGELSIEDKRALIDKKLAEDDDTLSFVTFMMGKSEK